MKRFARVYLALAVATALGVTGCGKKTDVKAYKSAEQNDHKTQATPHVHKAPHGGHLIEIGDHKYNAEIVFDETTRETTIYILGGHAEKAVAVAHEVLTFELGHGDHVHDLEFIAKPLDGESGGKSSRFVLAAKDLPEEIKDEEDFVGTIWVTLDGELTEVVVKHEDGDGHKEHGEADKHKGGDKHDKDADDKDHKDNDKDHKDEDKDHKDGDKDHKDADKDHKEAAKPDAPKDSDKPVEAAKPDAPKDGDKPAEAAKPDAPKDGDKPAEAAKPDAPKDGDKPAEAAKPDTPKDSDKPAEAAKPDTPKAAKKADDDTKSDG